MHDNSWSDRKWRNRNHSNNHPIRTSKLGVHSKDVGDLIRNVLENLQNTLSRQNYLLLE